MTKKAVLISIRPRWVSLILSGEKRLELRRTRPNTNTPFKCYIYCSKGKRPWVLEGVPGIRQDGHVVAEFICDKITRLTHVGVSGVLRPPSLMAVTNEGRGTIEPAIEFDNDRSCLSSSEVEKYLEGGDGFAWHISNLIIYDQPRKIGEFRRICHNDLHCESCAMHYTHNGTCDKYSLQVRRPPQTWCYVEELEENNGKQNKAAV